MAIKGSLKEASLPDVIQLLALGRRSGCLSVADRQNFGYIYFDAGRIVYASIVNRRDRLGDLLIRSGRLSEDRLREAIAIQARAPDRKIGQVLVEMGALTQEDLESHIRVQIEEAVYYLFTWTSGSFNFEAGVRPEREDLLVSLNPENLLLEGARRVDEWELIAKKIPSFDLLFTLDPSQVEGSDVDLSAEQHQLLPLLDGTRDVRQLMEETGLAEFSLGQALFGLISAGFAHRTGTSTMVSPPRATDARVDEHRNLGVAFLRTGMLDEAAREFRRVADLRPQEGAAFFHLGVIALKQARWADAVESLEAAIARGGQRPGALHNLAFALERLGRLDDADRVYDDAAARSHDDPRLLIGWAVLAIKMGRAHQAIDRLKRARDLLGDPVPALWYWANTLAHAVKGEAGPALECARQGVASYPSHAILANALAVLLESTGAAAEAESLLRRSTAEEPTLPQLWKNLADLCYRSGRYDEAAEHYERAAKLAPDLGDDLYFKLGNIAFKRRETAAARERWQRATELNPSHQLARANLELLDAAS